MMTQADGGMEAICKQLAATTSHSAHSARTTTHMHKRALVRRNRIWSTIYGAAIAARAIQVDGADPAAFKQRACNTFQQ